MAYNTLPSALRSAKTERVSSSLTATTGKAVDMARQHLSSGNPGGYARLLAGQHRASTTRQQLAIEVIIAADACSRLFTRHPLNGCLIAREG